MTRGRIEFLSRDRKKDRPDRELTLDCFQEGRAEVADADHLPRATVGHD